MLNCSEIKQCIACGSDDLFFLFDLKNQPLANSYKQNENDEEEYFPLAINLCNSCSHVQLTYKVNPNLLFKNYLYVSGTTKTQLEYFDWFAKFALENHDGDVESVLDIGCNDGSQLDFFKKEKIKTYGIDPALNLFSTSSKNHEIICDYFNNYNFDSNKKFDIIVCQNAFAHNFNQLEFLQKASTLMNDKTKLYITTSQSNMILNNEFDTIYHEHLSFYNIKSMDRLCTRAGLNLIDVTKHTIHGTSYIFVISLKKKRPTHILNLINNEHNKHLYDKSTYIRYVENCTGVLNNFSKVIEKFKQQGRSVIGYGAAAKGNTLLNAANVKLDMIIDDNPLKQGLYTPGISSKIVSPEVLLEFDQKEKIVFIPLAWNFFKEIKERIKNKRPSSQDLFVKYFPNFCIEE